MWLNWTLMLFWEQWSPTFSYSLTDSLASCWSVCSTALLICISILHTCFNPYTEVAIWLNAGHLWFCCDQERGFAFINANERNPSQIYSCHVLHLHIYTTIQQCGVSMIFFFLDKLILSFIKDELKAIVKTLYCYKKYISIKCCSSKESWKKVS